METFRKFINPETYGRIDEAGINRVISKLKNNQDFIMITAFRGEFSLKQNVKRNNQLIKDLRTEIGSKAGAYKMVGHWKECSVTLGDNETIKDCTKKGGEVTNELEESWLVMIPSDFEGDFDEIAQNISKKYNQDAYVIRENGTIYLKGKDGSVWDDLGKATDKSLKIGFGSIIDLQGYSELKKDRNHGRTNNIVFESFGISIPNNNISSKRLFSAMNLLF